MSFMVLQGAVEQGLIYALVSLGIYISYRTLDIADLTTDGTFTLGAATSAILTTLGHPVLGIFMAMVAGVLAGGVTALLQTKLRVQPILAGIITMTALYSINLMVMGNKPNLPLLKNNTIFSMTENFLGKNYNKMIVIFIVIIIVSISLIVFLGTQLGLSIRATGDNRAMVAASSINPAFTVTVGLCLANSIVALAGALLAQYQRFSANDVGTGMVVIGLASLIIGEVIVGRGGVKRCILGAIIGAILYRIIIAFAITSNVVSASNLKLFSAIIVAAAISYPAIKSAIAFRKQRKAGSTNVKTK
ncbi:MAG: ABC transporter permease [Oscillospiraceae bacterium]